MGAISLERPALGDQAIDQLFVEPRCQGIGIGTALLEQAKWPSPAGITPYTHQRKHRARVF